MSDAVFSDSVRNIEDQEQKIAIALQSTLNIAAKVKLVEPRSLPRSEGKAARVIDKRII
ncbi:hypothetical protein SDC9_191317 [bioreactor metagenome]|uniref:AMP-dependent ligase C-terminal domain-containing protein n=1 Tax=bioreactor metagenome TaxID=1076179 RepID=A0A645HXN6_9ZZZZ